VAAVGRVKLTTPPPPTANDPVSNVARVRIIWNKSGLPAAVNVMHFRYPPGKAINQALADSLHSRAVTALTGSTLSTHLATIVTLGHVNIRDLNTANQVEFVSAGTNTPGTAVGDPLPGATSCVITLRTALAGKSFRGRFYGYGYAESENDTTGNATAAACTATRDFVQQFAAAAQTGESLTACIVSRFSKKDLRPTPISTDVISYESRNTQWETQRRRNKPGI
jgi:hypothetical protein